jgi:uncharacterized protein involved in cysteine biosynthesis
MPRQSFAEVAAGFRLPFQGARLLMRERALTAWMPVLAPTSWLSWLWIAPARLGLALFGGVLFLAAAGLCLVAAYLTASLLAAPFHDALAARVERLLAGREPEPHASGPAGLVRDAARALFEELRRLLFFAALALPLAGLGALVPAAQIATAPALLLLTLFFLPLDYASYCFDRRRLRFADKRRFLMTRAPRTLGFGAAAFLACAVPGASWLAMPVLVVAGTLFALGREAP